MVVSALERSPKTSSSHNILIIDSGCSKNTSDLNSMQKASPTTYCSHNVLIRYSGCSKNTSDPDAMQTASTRCSNPQSTMVSIMTG
jgi:hypothetical protein